jgi:hypothetical protein
MKKTVIILSTIALIAGSYGQETKKQSEIETTDALQFGENMLQWQEENRQQEMLPPISERFLSYFPDMALGTHSEVREIIPQEIATEFLPYFIDSEHIIANYFAVGKIMNYKGLDLLIFDYEGARADEDSYDNHVDRHRFLLPYKNGVPLTQSPESGEGLQLGYTMDYHYHGEGGETIIESYFDTDTTLITHSYNSESVSATGYDTPLVYVEEYRWTLNSEGEQEILEVRILEFLSPFYDRDFLKKQHWTEWAEESGRAFPTKNDKWGLGINILRDARFALTNPKIDVYFYVEKIDGEYIPVFESYINENLIDRYSVGLSRSNTKVEKNYAARSTILKCPIIIKTSDGELEVLPNGKFLSRDQ